MKNVQSNQNRMENGESKYVFNERGNCECDNGTNNSDQKIYASTARIYGNDECPSRDFGDSLQYTNWILSSGAT